MKRFHRSGFTLAELLVYIGGLGLLLSCIYGVLLLSLGCFRVSQAAADLQSSAQKAVLRISAELSESNIGSVSSGANYVVFCSPRGAIDQYDQDASGSLRWQKWVSYWVDTSGRLWRSEQLIASPPTSPPAAASAPALATLKASSRTRLVATGVDVANSSPLLFTMANGAVTVTANFANATQSANRCQTGIVVKCRN